MAKQKKKKRRNTSLQPATQTSVGSSLKRFNWKRLILIVLTTVLAFGIYEALIILNVLPIGGIPIIMPVYFVIITVLLCLILIFNSGVSTKEITPEMLRADEDDDAEHLQAICDKLNARKQIAKRLMLVLIPFLFAVLLDVLYLFYGDFFKGALSALTGS